MSERVAPDDQQIRLSQEEATELFSALPPQQPRPRGAGRSTPADLPRPSWPLLTYSLMFANVLCYLLPATVGLVSGSALLQPQADPIETSWLLQRLGALRYDLVFAEPWRLLTATTLHGGLVHLFVNTLALFTLGARLERLLGAARFGTLYFLAGAGGSIASVYWRGDSNTLGVGASGSICGAAAGLLVTWVVLRHWFAPGAALGAATRLTVLLCAAVALPMILDSWMVTGIDHAAHVGGALTGGLLAALIVGPLLLMSRGNVGRWSFRLLATALLVTAYAGPLSGIFQGPLTVADLAAGLERQEVEELGIAVSVPGWSRNSATKLPSWRGVGAMLQVSRFESPIRGSTPSLRSRLQDLELEFRTMVNKGEIRGHEKVDHIDRVGQRPGGILVTYVLDTPHGDVLYMVRFIDLPHAAVDLALQQRDGPVARKVGPLILNSVVSLKDR
ncbi:MAG: rhomboid family intramembrane serine protease [Planctomycetota bacterium]